MISPTISSTISSTTALASSQTILSTQTTQITPVSTQDTQQTTSTVAIFISFIAAFIVIGFLIAFFTVCHHKRKRYSLHTCTYTLCGTKEVVLAIRIYVTGFGKTCIVHTSDFANSKVHKTQ